jgi:hypothetical protein
MYLELIMKADRLLSLLEYQRLRRYMTNFNCDKEFSRVDRLLKSVASTAFGLVRGLRQRTYAATENEESTNATPLAADNGEKASASKVEDTDTANSPKSRGAEEIATSEPHDAALAE